MNPNADTLALREQASRAAAAGHHAEACEHYRELARLEPREVRWSIAAAESLRALGYTDEAVRSLRETATAHAAGQRYLRAAAACRAALRMAPRDPETLKLLMEVMGALDDYDGEAEDEPQPAPRAPRASRPSRHSRPSAPEISLIETEGNGAELDLLDASLAYAERSETGTAGISEVHLDESAPRRDDPGYEDLALDESVFDGPPPASRVYTAPVTASPQKPASAALSPVAPPPSRRGASLLPAAKPLNPERLRGIPLLGLLPPDAVAAFVERSEYLVAAPGDRVIVEGDAASEVFLVVSGDLVATRGDPPRILARLGEGTFFGEMVLLDDAPRSATVTAVGDVELLALSRRLVLEICDRYPAVLSSLMQSLRTRIIATLTTTSPLFATIPRAERAAFVARFRLRDIDAGTTFIREGQQVEGLHVLLMGRAEVLAGETLVATVSTGDVVGEMSLLSGGRAQASVRAATRVSSLVLPARDVAEIMMVHPQVLDHLAVLFEDRRAALETARAGGNVTARSVRRV